MWPERGPEPIDGLFDGLVERLTRAFHQPGLIDFAHSIATAARSTMMLPNLPVFEALSARWGRPGSGVGPSAATSQVPIVYAEAPPPPPQPLALEGEAQTERSSESEPTAIVPHNAAERASQGRLLPVVVPLPAPDETTEVPSPEAGRAYAGAPGQQTAMPVVPLPIVSSTPVPDRARPSDAPPLPVTRRVASDGGDEDRSAGPLAVAGVRSLLVVEADQQRISDVPADRAGAVDAYTYSEPAAVGSLSARGLDTYSEPAAVRSSSARGFDSYSEPAELRSLSPREVSRYSAPPVVVEARPSGSEPDPLQSRPTAVPLVQVRASENRSESEALPLVAAFTPHQSAPQSMSPGGTGPPGPKPTPRRAPGVIRPSIVQPSPTPTLDRAGQGDDVAEAVATDVTEESAEVDELDIETIVDRVQRQFMRRMEVEYERRGGTSWR